MLTSKIFLFVFLLVFESFALSWNYGGYIKNLESHGFGDNLDSSFQTNLLHIRLNQEWDLLPSLKFVLQGRQLTSYGNSTALAHVAGYTLNLDWRLIDKPSLKSQLEWDRVHFKGSMGPVDYSFGRQRVNWGIASFWNPNDLFNVYDFTDVDYEERPGSDGLDLEWFFMDNMSIRGAAAFSDKLEDVIAAAMLKSNFLGYDWQWLGGRYKGDLVLGSGWAGSIINAGFKGEFSYFYTDNPSAIEDKHSVNISLGLDYFFQKPFYAQLAFLYNSQGIDNEENAMEILTQRVLSPKNLMPTAYNAMVQISWTATPLLQLSFASLYAPGPNALFLMPSLNYSLAQNWGLSLTGQSWSFGPWNQYENVINLVYAQLKWSF